jgi:hypothetical protein
MEINREDFNARVAQLRKSAAASFGADSPEPSVPERTVRAATAVPEVRAQSDGSGMRIVDSEALQRAIVEASDLAAHDGHPRAVWSVQGMRFRVDPVGLAPVTHTVWQSDREGTSRLSRWHGIV